MPAKVYRKSTLVDTTNLLSANNPFYYPTVDGLDMDSFSHISFQIKTSANLNIKIEATNDTDWFDITLSCFDSVNNSSNNASYSTDCFLHLDQLNVSKVRVVVVASSDVNNLKIVSKRKF